MNKTEHTRSYTGAYASLRNGRRPFAFAELIGGIFSYNTNGRIEFFMTPLGMLVYAKFGGLPKSICREKQAVYNFCIRGENGYCEKAGLHTKCSPCFMMPSVYEKDGYAECGALTRRIRECDLLGKTVILYDKKGGCPCNACESIAYGRISF